MPLPPLPDPIPELDPAPTRDDDGDDFEGLANDFLGDLRPWGIAINVAIAFINAAVTAADAIADEAEASAVIAAGAANFKGQWSSLTGALAVPASVAHNGAVYVLLANAADVTAIVPGVSSQWLAVLSVPLYALPIMQANAGYVAASAMEVLGAYDFDSLLPALSGAPAYGAYSGSNYVVTGNSSTSSVATSPDGETWTLRTMPSSSSWGPIASNGSGKVMAFVPNSTVSAISTNHGVTWSACTATGGTVLVQGEHGLHHVGGLWLAPTGNNSIGYYTSADDGATWVSRSFPVTAPSTSQFFMVGSTLWFRQTATATTAYTTTDGINWTTRASSVPAGTLVPGTYPDGSLWGCVGTVLHRTTDGITWSQQSVQTQVSGSLPAEVNGVKLVLSGSLVYTHDQGAWTARAKGIVTAVDLPYQYSVRSFKARGTLNGLYMQLGHINGRVALIKPGSGSPSGLFRKA